jgi:hypothetical protein
MPAESRLADTEARGGAQHLALAGYRKEIPKVIPIHVVIFAYQFAINVYLYAKMDKGYSLQQTEDNP